MWRRLPVSIVSMGDSSLELEGALPVGLTHMLVRWCWLLVPLHGVAWIGSEREAPGTSGRTDLPMWPSVR